MQNGIEMVGEETIEAPEGTEEQDMGDREEGPMAADKIGLRDIGNGLVLMGGLLLLCYFVLLLISISVQVEPGQTAFALPSYMTATLVLSIGILVAGLVIRRICTVEEVA